MSNNSKPLHLLIMRETVLFFLNKAYEPPANAVNVRPTLDATATLTPVYQPLISLP